MAKVKIRYWKDIPVSVHVTGEADKANVQLPKIYMVTVDAVATRTGITGSGDYVAGFRAETLDRDGPTQAIAAAVIEELKEKYPPAWLREQRKLAGIGAEIESRIEAEARES
jgi:hypothetical protein